MLKSVLKDIFGRKTAARNLGKAEASAEETAVLARELLNSVRDIGTYLQSLRDVTYGVYFANALQLLDFDLERHPRYGDPKRLLRYAFQVCSQNFEDGMIHEIFRRIGAPTRTFVEIGVGDGRECNTAFLLSQGWTGFWLDGAGLFLETLKGRVDLGDGCLKYRVAHVSRENIATLLGDLGAPAEFDLLSLDVDLNTYYVWEGLKQFRPRVVVIEYNAAIPPDTDWKVHYDPGRTWDGTQNFGASLRAFEILGSQLGYSLVGCNFTGVNAFFVRSDLVADLFAAPFTAENHYEPPRYHLGVRRSHARAILDRMSNTSPDNAGNNLR